MCVRLKCPNSMDFTLVHWFYNQLMVGVVRGVTISRPHNTSVMLYVLVVMCRVYSETMYQQAPSSALAVLGMLQPGAFTIRFLDP